MKGVLWTAVTAILAVAVVAGVVLFLLPVTYHEWVDEPLKYRIVDRGADAGGLLNWEAWGWVVVQNSDVEPGTFDVSFEFETLDKTYRDTDRLYIYPGERKKARGTGDIEFGEKWRWSVVVTPGTKKVLRTTKIRLYQKVFGRL